MEKYQNEAVSDMIERHEGIIMKEQINDYLHYLNIERGLSANTRQSYERDLEQYLHFLQEQKNCFMAGCRSLLVIRFLEKLHEEKSDSNCYSDDLKSQKIPSVLARAYH